MKKIYLFFILIAVFSFIIFLLHLKLAGTAIYGDGRYYYSTARSLALDSDLNFANEYQTLNLEDKVLPNGLLANKYPPGASFFWILPIWLIHLLLNFLTNLGIYVNNSGFSSLYQIVIGLETIILAVGGLFFLTKTLTKFYPEKVSLLASVGIFFTTNLLFYSSFDVINSHPVSFFVSSLFFYVLLVVNDKHLLFKWISLGLLAGLLVLTRTQDLVLILPALIIMATQKINLKRKILLLTTFIIIAGLTFFPQLLIWKTLYNTFTSPYLGGIEGFTFFKPHLSDLLFNVETGLIIWTPLVFIALLGLFCLKKDLAFLKKIFIGVVILQIYLISSWSSWNQGGSFGVRMLISSLPLLAFGYARLIEILLNNFKPKITYLLLGLLSLANVCLITLHLIIY